MASTKLSIGLEHKEMKQYGELLIKANPIQLNNMLIMMQHHILERYKRGLM